MKSDIQKLTMSEALTMLASLYRDGEKKIIEDQYCSTCSIGSKIRTIGRLDDDMIYIDNPRDLIVGVGGIYAPDETYPGGARPIYRVV
jgi:hypothetical protein